MRKTTIEVEVYEEMSITVNKETLVKVILPGGASAYMPINLIKKEKVEELVVEEVVEKKYKKTK